MRERGTPHFPSGLLAGGARPPALDAACMSQSLPGSHSFSRYVDSFHIKNTNPVSYVLNIFSPSPSIKKKKDAVN